MAKRILDIVVSLACLVATSPLLIVAAIAVRATSAGPVFYRGVRVGKDGQPFRMFKFRTMVDRADKMGGSSTAADDPRLTRVGKWLRRTKLDEFPQFLNVLAGTMSLVGPRPQVPWVVDGYTDEQRRVLSVRPGITDPASLRFRNEAEILRGYPDADQAYFELIHPEKMRLALNYVANRTFVGDLRILLATVGAVLGFSASEPVPPKQPRSFR